MFRDSRFTQQPQGSEDRAELASHLQSHQKPVLFAEHSAGKVLT